MSIFSAAEIEGRQRRFRGGLGDCDVGVAFSFTNAYYLSGVPIIPWGRPTITVVPRDGPPAMILAAGEEARARLHSPIAELVTYRDEDGPNAAAAIGHLAALLRQRGLTRIAIDAAGTPVRQEVPRQCERVLGLVSIRRREALEQHPQAAVQSVHRGTTRLEAEAKESLPYIRRVA